MLVAREHRVQISVRQIAVAIDGLLLVLACGAAQLVFRRLDVTRVGPAYVPDMPALVVLGAALVWSLSEVAFDASPGKYVLGMRVRSANGDRATLAQRWLRWMLKSSPILVMIVAQVLDVSRANRVPVPGRWVESAVALCGVACAAVFFGFCTAGGRRRQALYDMLAGTAVFDARHESPAVQGFEPVLRAERATADSSNSSR